MPLLDDSPVATREWLYSLPCVITGRVRIDVRGVYPVAIVGLKARTIYTRNDFYYFVAESL